MFLIVFESISGTVFGDSVFSEDVGFSVDVNVVPQLVVTAVENDEFSDAATLLGSFLVSVNKQQQQQQQNKTGIMVLFMIDLQECFSG